jgi:hypothetical protein
LATSLPADGSLIDKAILLFPYITSDTILSLNYGWQNFKTGGKE